MKLAVFFCLIGAAFAVPFSPISALPLVRTYNSVNGLESPHYYAGFPTDVAGRSELAHPVHYVARFPHAGYETVDTPFFARTTEGVVPHVHVESAPLVESPVYIKSVPIYEKPSYGTEFGAGFHVPTVYKAFPAVFAARSGLADFEAARFVETPVYGRDFGSEAFSPIVYKAFPTVLATRTPIFVDQSVDIPASADLYGKSFPTQFAVRSPLAAYPETVAPHHFKSIYPTESFSAYKTFPAKTFSAYKTFPAETVSAYKTFPAESFSAYKTFPAESFSAYKTFPAESFSAYKTFPAESFSAYKTFPAESFSAYKTFPVHQDVAPVNAFHGRHINYARTADVPAVASPLF